MTEKNIEILYSEISYVNGLFTHFSSLSTAEKEPLFYHFIKIQINYILSFPSPDNIKAITGLNIIFTNILMKFFIKKDFSTAENSQSFFTPMCGSFTAINCLESRSYIYLFHSNILAVAAQQLKYNPSFNKEINMELFFEIAKESNLDVEEFNSQKMSSFLTAIYLEQYNILCSDKDYRNYWIRFFEILTNNQKKKKNIILYNYNNGVEYFISLIPFILKKEEADDPTTTFDLFFLLYTLTLQSIFYSYKIEPSKSLSDTFLFEKSITPLVKQLPLPFDTLPCCYAFIKAFFSFDRMPSLLASSFKGVIKIIFDKIFSNPIALYFSTVEMERFLLSFFLLENKELNEEELSCFLIQYQSQLPSRTLFILSTFLTTLLNSSTELDGLQKQAQDSVQNNEISSLLFTLLNYLIEENSSPRQITIAFSIFKKFPSFLQLDTENWFKIIKQLYALSIYHDQFQIASDVMTHFLETLSCTIKYFLDEKRIKQLTASIGIYYDVLKLIDYSFKGNRKFPESGLFEQASKPAISISIELIEKCKKTIVKHNCNNDYDITLKIIKKAIKKFNFILVSLSPINKGYFIEKSESILDDIKLDIKCPYLSTWYNFLENYNEERALFIRQLLATENNDLSEKTGRSD